MRTKVTVEGKKSNFVAEMFATAVHLLCEKHNCAFETLAPSEIYCILESGERRSVINWLDEAFKAIQIEFMVTIPL